VEDMRPMCQCVERELKAGDRIWSLENEEIAGLLSVEVFFYKM
jgi:hypothetical protein